MRPVSLNKNSKKMKQLYTSMTVNKKNYTNLRCNLRWLASEWPDFGEEPGEYEEGSPYGMKVDMYGNLHVTGPKGIWVGNADGRHIGRIVLPEQPANLAWGDDDYRTLYHGYHFGLSPPDEGQGLCCLLEIAIRSITRFHKLHSNFQSKRLPQRRLAPGTQFHPAKIIIAFRMLANDFD